MKILVTGATGFVGRRLMQDLPGAIAAPSLREATYEDLLRLIDENEIEAIVHTAAVSDIGACDKDPEGSYKANVLLPIDLARASRHLSSSIKLACFSSDQVYSGMESEGPYVEDFVNPGNLYAREKIEMEQRVLDIDPASVMLRAEWMYDNISYKGNYFLNLLSATGSIVASSTNFRGVTYVKEVSETMPAVLAMPGGIYNYGSETTASMYDITRDFIQYLGKDLTVQDAPSRHNLWMDCSKARKHDVIFSDVLTGLKRCADDYHITK